MCATLLNSSWRMEHASQNSAELIEAPSGMSLDEFKRHVRLWMDMDNEIKATLATVKEKKKVQGVLTEKILAFMTRYNIEDLNTRDGKLRYRVSRVKPSVRQKQIKERLQDCFKDNPDMAAKVLSEVFKEEGQEDNVVERPTLRRLKGAVGMNV